jgi:hypothetical protein
MCAKSAVATPPIVMAGEHAPANAGGRPSTSFLYYGSKDVNGGAKPRHDDVQRAVPLAMHFFPHES